MNQRHPGKNGPIRRLARGLGGTAARRPMLTLLLLSLLTAGLAPFAAGVDYDDDVLDFLPSTAPEVAHFREIGDRFHGLSVAVVGIEAVDDDLFGFHRIRALRTLTRALNEIPGVAFATGFTEQRDIAIDDAGTTLVNDLVPKLAPEAEASYVPAELRAHVLARDHIRGFLVSADGGSALLLANLDESRPVKEIADDIRRVVDDELEDLPGLVPHYGGAPFIGSYVATVARRDIVALSPWVALAVILIVLATARSFMGALIALASVGVAIVWIIGLLDLLGRPLTLVSSSLPMLLMALGSAYSIHLLAKILANIDAGLARLAAIDDALGEAGPPIIIAGLTTAIGFVSFLAMDIPPMREFGLLMAVGTLLVVALGLITVSAASALLPLKARAGGRTPRFAEAALGGTARYVRRRPRVALVICLGVASSLALIDRRPAALDMGVFFDGGSEPVIAEKFLEEKLGGALFVQVEIKGDIKDPLVLRQIERIADLAAAQPGVGGVQSIVVPITLGARGLAGVARVPDSPKLTRALAALLRDEDPALGMMVDDAWRHALVQIKVSAQDPDAVLALVETLQNGADALASPRIQLPRSEASAAHLRREREEVAQQLSTALPDVELQTILTAFEKPLPNTPELATQIRKQLRRDVVDDEMIYLAEGTVFAPIARRLADSAVAGTLTADGLYAALSAVADPEERENPKALRKATDSLFDGVEDIQRKARRFSRTKHLADLLDLGDAPAKRAQVERITAVLEDPLMSLPASAVPDKAGAAVPLAMKVSGYPVVYDAMNRAVNANQERSLAVAGGLVLLALALFFRSLPLAIVALIPATLTLAVVFGIMGLLAIPMNVGTSMVASIALGVGIDYAVHYVWRQQHEAPDTAWSPHLSTTAWGIVINALEVTAGFAILMLGALVPMQHVGLLTAVAMLVSAVVTLTVLPALAHRFRPLASRSAP